MDLRQLCATHGVTIDRAEPIPDAWLPLVEEWIVRMLASGWRHRRLAQVKEKLGSLCIFIERAGEPPEVLGWAQQLTREMRARAGEEQAPLGRPG